MSWQFNGTNSALYIPSGSWTTMSASGHTISIWFYVEAPGPTQQWFFHRSGAASTDGGVSIRITESNNIITTVGRDVNNTAGSTYTINSFSPAGEWSTSGWVHTVITRSRNVPGNVTATTNDDIAYHRFYINSVIVDSATITGAREIVSGPMVFGRRGDTATNTTLQGNLAEYAMWDRVLSESEISKLYRGHSPEFLAPVIYFPMRNDYVDRVLGITGGGVNNVTLATGHPIAHRRYLAEDDSSVSTPNLAGRVGVLETRGYSDFVSYSPGTIEPTGFAQSSILFSQGRVGDAYVIAGNTSLSGCIATAQVDVSGSLTITVRNPTNLVKNVQATSWRVYKL
jgi:hypothetical protein